MLLNSCHIKSKDNREEVISLQHRQTVILTMADFLRSLLMNTYERFMVLSPLFHTFIFFFIFVTGSSIHTSDNMFFYHYKHSGDTKSSASIKEDLVFNVLLIIFNHCCFAKGQTVINNLIDLMRSILAPCGTD